MFAANILGPEKVCGDFFWVPKISLRILEYTKILPEMFLVFWCDLDPFSSSDLGHTKNPRTIRRKLFVSPKEADMGFQYQITKLFESIIKNSLFFKEISQYHLVKH